MVTVNLILLLLIIPTVLLMSFLARGKTRLFLVFTAIGIFAAYLSGQINSVIGTFAKIAEFDISIHVSPVVEEFLKALPLVVFFFVIKPEKRFILECSIWTGLGFAFFENAWAFSQTTIDVPTWEDISFALSRGFGASIVHSICSLIFIYGVYVCSRTHKLTIPGTLAMFSLVCSIHSMFNVLIKSKYAVAPFVFTIGIYIILLCFSLYQRKLKQKQKSDHNAIINAK